MSVAKDSCPSQNAQSTVRVPGLGHFLAQDLLPEGGVRSLQRKTCCGRENVLPQSFRKKAMAVYPGHSAHWERGIVKHAKVVFFFPFFIGVYLLNNTVLFSPVQQSESAIMYTYTPFFFFLDFLSM